ncbi:hypothetical protein [Microbacterium sp. ZXX196]|uniref:hypothetical protein n=1 Tax=Microbacterium sp. ZXX196 TaxID=2609291 RepID=UPI0012B886C2|nr:hypothetical protein [Microbacterium sp. ZXX196]MTE24856.1 hypothetical protein [Microbacterium sp. ZXX196]
MNTREAFQLLTLASAFDGRTVDRETATVWAEVLVDIDLSAATEAMKAHYRDEGRWMMPAHVVQRVKQSRRAVEGGTMSPRRVDCQREGREHRWLPDGTCNFCEVRAL